MGAMEQNGKLESRDANAERIKVVAFLTGVPQYFRALAT